jgi:hypothetical protein
MRRGERVLPVRYGFTVRDAGGADAADEAQCLRDIDALAGYVVRMLGSDPLPTYLYDPVSGERIERGTAARGLHALIALDEAGELRGQPAWRELAAGHLTRCLAHLHTAMGETTLRLTGHEGGALADCVLLAGAARLGGRAVGEAPVRALAARVRRMLQDDGRICDHPNSLAVPQDHDFLPGVALWALSRYAEAAGEPATISLAAQLAWHRRRFRLLHPWGMVGWQAQGWEAVHAIDPDPRFAALVFEVADWALERQLDKNGAFLEDLSPHEPSFNTGFIAEGIAAAWALARRTGDDACAARYEASFRAAARFLRSLIISPDDTFCLRDPDLAIGGVRSTPSSAAVRIDQVSHTLRALVAGARTAATAGATARRIA